MSQAATSDVQGFIDALAGTVETSEDASSHAIEGAVARAVVRPSTTEELGQVMASASERNVAVAPWGGGTRITLGNAPERLDAVVDLSGLAGVVDHNPADLTATVQAGITISRLQEVLGEHGQFLALDPPLPHKATLGGTLATAMSGPMKWQYGSPRDVVIGMKVVQADGKVIESGGQVVKNVSGYDMARLHVGGLGTLGIIAEVSLKLTPLPVGQSTLLAIYDDVRPSVEAGLAVFHSDVMPLALTAFDGSANERMGAVDVDGKGFLAIRLGGRPLTLERQIRECRSVCEALGPSEVRLLSDDDASGVWRRLADFGWDDDTTPQIGVRASLVPTTALELAKALPTFAQGGVLEPAMVAHPAHGTALLGWYGSDENEAAGLVGEIRDGVHRLEGVSTIERCPQDVKASIDIWDTVGDSEAVMWRLKEQYDPGRILNPGRFVGGI